MMMGSSVYGISSCNSWLLYLLQQYPYFLLMQFGKVNVVDEVRFELPPDHPETIGVLNASRGTDTSLKVWIGGTMWTIPQWVGSCYPAGTKTKQFAEAYGKQFGTIELNATHYRTPTLETVSKWKEGMPDDFLFCPKFPQGISHYRKFVSCEALTDAFLTAVSALGQQLGPCFIQLPPHFGADKAEILSSYLCSLPIDLQVAVEFRHESWFLPTAQVDAIWEVMQQRQMAAIITDTPGRRDVLHMRLSAPKLILRFGGYFPHASDALRIEQWMDRIQLWQQQGLNEVHVWIHQPESIYTPQSAVQWAKAFSDHLGVRTKAPLLVNTLF
jgi:uncharacterized protein YecE (DUF72 family)